MQVVDGQALDEGGEGHDEVVRCLRPHYRGDDLLVVLVAARLALARRVEELVDDVGVGDRHGLTDLGARVQAAQAPRKPHQEEQRVGVPLVARLARLVHAAELLLRIVDEGAEAGALSASKLGREQAVHLLADDPRAVVEDVQERLVLAVDVAHEVLGALGEVENRLEVDDLGERRLLRGEALREQLEVALILRA